MLKAQILQVVLDYRRELYLTARQKFWSNHQVRC